MNAIEIGKLLGEISGIDNRQVDEGTVMLWIPLVGDLDFSQSIEAVRLHRRESTAYLLPAHVRQGVERILVAGLGTRRDEWGNDLDEDTAAVGAWRRLQQQKGISA
ncbi:MAG: hypothetical protein JSS52_11460 [Proteobacteria bacterium]|nr:hypothetical protein [Pseudomonadota bacterium]